MKRTPEKQAEIEKLPRYWARVQTQTDKAQKYNYTKLVSREKAHRLIYGTFDGLSYKKTTSLTYKEV
jgi:hypothetical protein